VSEAFDDETILTTFELKCNWKLVYENLRDAHHPRFVHSQSIYKNVRFGVAMDEDAIAASKHLAANGCADRDEAMRTLRGFSNGGLNEAMDSLPDYAWHRNVQRYGDRDWYYNWLVYPNLHLASGSGGYSFIIEHHVPVSAGRTDLIVHYVTAKKRARYATSAAVLLEHMRGGARVWPMALAVALARPLRASTSLARRAASATASSSALDCASFAARYVLPPMMHSTTKMLGTTPKITN
jgi:phenylpropionate dioxygenase-like ring-hydroxylating dioxygenase large terminal subunit